MGDRERSSSGGVTSAGAGVDTRSSPVPLLPEGEVLELSMMGLIFVDWNNVITVFGTCVYQGLLLICRPGADYFAGFCSSKPVTASG